MRNLEINKKDSSRRGKFDESHPSVADGVSEDRLRREHP